METTRDGFEARETVLLVKKSFAFHKSRKGRGGKGWGWLRCCNYSGPCSRLLKKGQTLELITHTNQIDNKMIPWGCDKYKADWRCACLTPSERGGGGAGVCQERGRGVATAAASG